MKIFPKYETIYIRLNFGFIFYYKGVIKILTIMSYLGNDFFYSPILRSWHLIKRFKMSQCNLRSVL